MPSGCLSSAEGRGETQADIPSLRAPTPRDETVNTGAEKKEGAERQLGDTKRPSGRSIFAVVVGELKDEPDAPVHRDEPGHRASELGTVGQPLRSQCREKTEGQVRSHDVERVSREDGLRETPKLGDLLAPMQKAGNHRACPDESQLSEAGDHDERSHRVDS